MIYNDGELLNSKYVTQRQFRLAGWWEAPLPTPPPSPPTTSLLKLESNKPMSLSPNLAVLTNNKIKGQTQFIISRSGCLCNAIVWWISNQSIINLKYAKYQLVNLNVSCQPQALSVWTPPSLIGVCFVIGKTNNKYHGLMNMINDSEVLETNDRLMLKQFITPLDNTSSKTHPHSKWQSLDCVYHCSCWRDSFSFNVSWGLHQFIFSGSGPWPNAFL